MEKNITDTTITKATPTVTPTTLSDEELCGSTNILDTVHLKNLVDDI